MIIVLGDKQYAVGLNWLAVSAPEEIAQFQQEMELQDGLIKRSKDPTGPATVALTGSEYLGQISLAGILSYAYENLLFVAKTEYKDAMQNDLYYLCTIKKGIVSVDGDMIGDFNTIKALYVQNLFDLQADIPDAQIEKRGIEVDSDTFEGVQLVDWITLLTPAYRFESQCIIKALKVESNNKKYLLGVAILIPCLLFIGYELFVNLEPAPPPVVEVAPPPQIDPFDAFLNAQSNFFANNISPQVLPTAVQLLKTIPMHFKGWSVTELDLNLGSTTTVNLQLSRTTSYATANDLLAFEDGPFKKITIDQAGSAAVAEWTGSATGMTQVSRNQLLPLKQAQKKDQNYWALLSRFQSENMQVTFKESSNSINLSEQEFTLTGNGLWSLAALAQVMQGFDTLGLTEISIKIENGQYTWNIRGVIYG